MRERKRAAYRHMARHAVGYMLKIRNDGTPARIYWNFPRVWPRIRGVQKLQFSCGACCGEGRIEGEQCRVCGGKGYE